MATIKRFMTDESGATAIIKRFMTDESAATAIEYALLVALIAVVIITGVTSLGSNLKAKYNTVATDITNAS